MTYTSDPPPSNDAYDTVPYGARVYENLLELLNSGANAAIVWWADDQSWSYGWGLLTAAPVSTPRPVYWALQTIVPYLTSGNFRLLKPGNEPGDIYAAAFVSSDTLIVGLVNGSDAPVTRVLRIDGANALTLTASESFLGGQLGDAGPLEAAGQGLYEVTLPVDGVMTLRFSFD